MGVVYKAQDTKLDRLVALKFLPPELTRDPEAKQRFIQEAKAASTLDHPNICTVYEIGETAESQLFIAMAYYEGETLHQKIGNRQLAIEHAINYAIHTAEGLQAAHKKGITHRDIKSSNIMVTTEDQVKIMDFGLAKTTAATMMTKTGATVGTVPYMSPEQARGEKVDHRTDIWSLGVVMYETIAGRLPFKSEYNEAIVYSILNEEPKPLTSLRSDVPMELERIVKKCLEKDRNNRYQHADELIVDLRQVRAGVGKEAPREKVLKPTKPQWRNWYLIGGAALVVALLLFILVPRFTSHSEVISSIAVLPLENLSHDPEQEYFADGMTEALITDLAKISALRVISRTSVMHYKTTKKTIPEIAKELNVDAVVEGSVQRSGDRVRVTAQLLHAPTDRHLWAESYERNLTDVLALQSEVALSIAKEIRAKVTPQEETRFTSARPVNKEAYNLYLKGRYFWNKRTPEALRKAVEQFQQAIEHDPNYALGYVGLADCYLVLEMYASLPASESLPKAKAAADRALQLDESLAEAHTSSALIYQHLWRWAEAEAEYKRAISLNPNYPTAHHWFATYFRTKRQFNDDMREMKRALELDPLSPIIGANVAWVYVLKNDLTSAIEQSKRIIELDPSFPPVHDGLGWAYLKQRQYEDAIAEFQKAVELSGRSSLFLSDLGYCYAVIGRRAEAFLALKELEERYARRESIGRYVAGVYAGLGERDQAFAWLEKDFQQRSGQFEYITFWFSFEDLRRDPRYADFVHRMGLQASVSDKSSYLPSIEKPKAEASLKWQNSIAVLPFKNISSDKEQEYFCDGMTEQLITNLTNLPNVKVIARTSVMQFKNTNKTVPQIANELGVAHVLEGSVRKSGNKIRVTAQLIKADDGFHLWAKDYDRQLKDIFAVQDDVSNAIVEALKINLTSGQKSTITKRYTGNVDAYNLYLRGRYYWNKWTEDGFKKSVEYYQLAIEKDPTYALAYAGLAISYERMGYYGYLSPKDAWQRAKAAVMKAVEIDNKLAVAHAALARMQMSYDWNWLEAEREFRRAIELDPGYADAHADYAIYLDVLRRLPEALEVIKKAQELDPLSLIINTDLGLILWGAHEHDQAIQQLLKTLELDPTYSQAYNILGNVYLDKKMYKEAVAAMQKAVTYSSGDPMYHLAFLGHANAVAGQRKEALSILDSLKNQSKQRYVSAFYMALIYTGLGENQQALDFLEKAYEERSGWLYWLKEMSEFQFRPLRAESRYRALLKKMGLE